jgi:hypothetical protein
MTMRTAIAAALVGASATCAALAGGATAAPAPGQAATVGSDKASIVTYKNGSKRLVLARLSSGVELTRITPGHDRSRITVPEWASRWTRMYGKAEPNAVLTYGVGARSARTSWTLASAQYNKKRAELIFVLRPIAKGARKRMPVVPTGVHRKKVTTKALGPATLFVD